MNFRKREAVALASLAWRSFPDPADGVVVASSGFDENLGFPQGVEDHPMCTLKTEKEESEDAWGGVLGFCRRGGRQQREAGEYLKLCVWRSAHAVKTGHLLNRSG